MNKILATFFMCSRFFYDENLWQYLEQFIFFQKPYLHNGENQAMLVSFK
jgi:hypothetical protein